MSPPTRDLFESLAPVPASPALALVPDRPAGAQRPAARELWLCAYLPDLPLEALVAGGGSANQLGRGPACAVAGHGTKQTVIAASAAARRLGVVPGTGLNAALALVPGLAVRERQPAAEAALLDRLARWATQFTPLVSLEPPDAVLAEVRGSLGLFGGAEALRRRAGRELRGFGLHAVMAIAPTPRAALWLVRSGLGLSVESTDRLPALASRLPLACLRWPEAAARTLARLGARTVADLVRLPRDGLARRFGPALLDELDEGFGRRRMPRRRAAMPERFDERIDLPAESASLGLIEDALGRLLGRLQEFLRGRTAGIGGLAVEFMHRAGPATRFRLRLARPSGDGDHLLALLRERLARTPLPAPAVALRMRSTVALPLPLRNGALLDQARPGADPEDAARLVERLRARLGGDAVFSVCLVPEHRPESAWCIAEPRLAPGLPPVRCGERGGRGPRDGRTARGAGEGVPPAVRCGERGGRGPRDGRTARSAGEGVPPAVRCGERGGRGPRSERMSVERAERDPAGSRSPQQAPQQQPQQAPQQQPQQAPQQQPQRRKKQAVVPDFPAAPRPLWMLTEPRRLRERGGRPLHGGRPLEFLSGAERIESGWWDGHDVRRDYHAAVAHNGVRLWVYQERGREGGWWLHGVFG